MFIQKSWITKVSYTTYYYHSKINPTTTFQPKTFLLIKRYTKIALALASGEGSSFHGLKNRHGVGSSLKSPNLCHTSKYSIILLSSSSVALVLGIPLNSLSWSMRSTIRFQRIHSLRSCFRSAINFFLSSSGYPLKEGTLGGFLLVNLRPILLIMIYI